ncbi:unnamed protein product [Effrenium voratum]|nr:unnamed protein product [Effrenium voratum]
MDEKVEEEEDDEEEEESRKRRRRRKRGSAGEDGVQCSVGDSISRLAQQAQIEDHLPIAQHVHQSTGCPPFQAWSTAVERSQSRASTRVNFPVDALTVVLMRYGAFQGTCTTKIERLFSKIAKHIAPDRGCLDEMNELCEVKILADGGVAVGESPLLMQLAQCHWALNFGVPRAAPSHDRLDKGVPRKRKADTEADFLQKRRKAVAEDHDVSFEDIMAQAEDAAAQKEMNMQTSRRYYNKALAFLEGTLLESEVPLLEVAEAIKTVQQSNDEKRDKQARRCLQIMAPSAPQLQGTAIWLQDESLARLPECRNLRFVADKAAARIFCCDPDNPGQRTKWHVTLNGGTIVSTDYLRTGGKKGVAYQYEGAVTVRRHFFLSPEFAHAHPLLAEIVRAAAGHRQSKWKMVTTWESFLERLEQEKGKKTALALTVPEIVRNGIQHRRSGRGG